MSRRVITTTPFCILPYITLYTRRVSCIPANLFKCYCSEDSHHREDPIHEPSSKEQVHKRKYRPQNVLRLLRVEAIHLKHHDYELSHFLLLLPYLNERGRSCQQHPTLTFLCVREVCRPKRFRIESVWERPV